MTPEQEQAKAEILQLRPEAYVIGYGNNLGQFQLYTKPESDGIQIGTAQRTEGEAWTNAKSILDGLVAEAVAAGVVVS